MQLSRFTKFISLNIFLLCITTLQSQAQTTESTEYSSVTLAPSVLSSIESNATISVLGNSIVGTTNGTSSQASSTQSSTATEILLTGTRAATTSTTAVSTSVVVISGSSGSNATASTSTTYSTSSTVTAASEPTNTQPCNQHVEFCTRKYSNVTYIGAHNSPFVRQNNVASNQAFDVSIQLADGIRMCMYNPSYISTSPCS